MSSLKSRRNFIFNLGALATASVLPTRTLAKVFESPLYPPLDLSYFDTPITPAPAAMRFGYAAITWNGNDVQAIKEISELGFRGIQLRSNLLKEYGDKPQAIKDLLQQHKLQFVALSGGGPRTGDSDADTIATQVKNATFLHAAGGLYLQMTDSMRPKDGKPTAEDCKRLGRVLTEVGKRVTDMGVGLAYHNHMNTVGETPDEVDRIMDAADARYVKLLLDVAHYKQGGGDPAKAIKQYGERILFLHIKDVESPVPASAGEAAKAAYRFVELGRGKVDLPAVFAALKAIKFRGWAVVELDSVPDKTRTPKEAAMISKKFIEEKLKLSI